MSKHYRSDIDEYTSHPAHTTAGRVLRPKSLRLVNAAKELNRMRDKLKKAEASEAATQKLYQSWHDRALKAERIIKDMFAAD